MAAVKMIDKPPRAFPAQAAELTRPENALKVGNPLYATSSMNYGGTMPAQQDMPNKYFPRPEAFTATFLGGQFSDTGLNTASTKSRLPSHWDPWRGNRPKDGMEEIQTNQASKNNKSVFLSVTAQIDWIYI